MTTTIRREPVTIVPAPIRTVHVADPDSPGALLTLRVRWLCAVSECRRPRGETTRERLAYHDARGREIARRDVDRWRNPCGHLDLVTDLVAEAAALAEHQAAVRARARQCATPARRRSPGAVTR